MNENAFYSMDIDPTNDDFQTLEYADAQAIVLACRGAGGTSKEFMEKWNDYSDQSEGGWYHFVEIELNEIYTLSELTPQQVFTAKLLVEKGEMKCFPLQEESAFTVPPGMKYGQCVKFDEDISLIFSKNEIEFSGLF